MAQDRERTGTSARRGGQLSPAARRAAIARRKRRIRRNRILFALILLAFVAAVVLGVRALFALAAGGEEGSSSSAGSDSSAAQPTPTPAASTTSVDFSDGRMILVNNNLALPEGYTVETQTADADTGKELQTEAAQSFAAMQAAAKLEGVSLILQSGYRSVEYQQGLFDQQVEKMIKTGLSEEQAKEQAKTVVAVPGYSEHNTGYAADILTDSYRVMDSAFADTDAYAWLVKHAAEYGFIERYPEDKSAITGIIFEPWHWRYVGAENAAAIQASGLCLEEFWATYGSAASADPAPESGSDAASGSDASGSDASGSDASAA